MQSILETTPNGVTVPPNATTPGICAASQSIHQRLATLSSLLAVQCSRRQAKRRNAASRLLNRLQHGV